MSEVNSKVAEVELLVLEGLAVIVVFGTGVGVGVGDPSGVGVGVPPVETVQVWLAGEGSTPAGFLALTSKVWDPSARPVMLKGEVQAE
jgi:hypothetical protein